MRLRKMWERGSQGIRGGAEVWCVVFLSLGLWARIATFASYRVLWRDETLTAVAIAEQPWSRLFAPLGYYQILPPLYVVQTKLSFALLGLHEYAARFPPLAASVAALLLFSWVAWRLFGPLAAMFALGLFAAHGLLAYYAAEAKPYGADAFWALAVLAGAMLLDRQTPLRVRRVLGVATLGVFAVCSSMPAVFMLAGVGTAQLIAAATMRDRRRFVLLGTAYALPALAFGLLYFGIYNAAMTNANTPEAEALIATMQELWAYAFAPSPWADGARAWYANQAQRFFYTPGGFAPVWAAQLLAIAGAGWLVWSRRARILGYLVLPVVVALLASMLRAYPFDGRMLVFAVPGLCLLVGAGGAVLVAMGRAGNVRPRHVAGALAGLGLVGALLGPMSLRALAKPWQQAERIELDHALAYIARAWQPGDAMYLNNLDALSFYFARYWYDFPPEAVRMEAQAFEAVTPAEAFVDEWPRLREARRVWLPFHALQEDTYAGILAQVPDARLAYRDGAVAVYNANREGTIP